MTEIAAQADIRCPADAIFDVIIDFHQPMTMRLHAGIADVVMRYTLMPGDGSARVRRVVTLGVPWSLRLAQPVLIRAFRTESTRTLLALKAYADTLPTS